jgi:hypothetical protein
METRHDRSPEEPVKFRRAFAILHPFFITFGGPQAHGDSW